MKSLRWQRNIFWACVSLALPGLASSLSAATVKDREAAVRGDRAALGKDARWLYGDITGGFALAKERNKPLLVVLRCVPCLSCMGIDASVLEEKSLAPLLDQFVCVRVINANALDLALFQFDYDLSFSTMFFNGDGTIYGRYGSWLHQKDPQEKTVEGYRRALEGALALHKQYPKNKGALAGKQGVAVPFKTPVEFPALAGKYKSELDWSGKVVGSCVHCHQIGDAYRTWHRAERKPVPSELIYPMPPPETVGLTLAGDAAARVRAMEQGSAAAQAGFQEGDELISLAGQPLLSVADVSWALHRAPESGAIPAVVKRGRRERKLELTLPAGWRTRADIARRVGTWEMRAMATGGLLLEDLPAGARRERGLAQDKLALNVKHVGQYGKHAAGKKAGFQKDDVIVEVDGSSARQTEGELIGRLLQQHLPGTKVRATVLRGIERVELVLPLQ